MAHCIMSFLQMTRREACLDQQIGQIIGLHTSAELNESMSQCVEIMFHPKIQSKQQLQCLQNRTASYKIKIIQQRQNFST